MKNQNKTQFITGQFIFILLLGLFISTDIQAQNTNAKSWTQFRGNNRNGISSETGILTKWPDEGPEKLWSKNIGSGFPEVVVDNGITYLLAGDTINNTEYVQAFDALTGKEIWKTEIDSLYHEVDGWGHGPRSTPAIDGENIYCLSGFGKFCALASKDGKLRWKVNVPVEFEGAMPRWGYTSSPLLIDHAVVLETGGKDDKALTAFDTSTGKAIWSKGDGKSGYNSPGLAEIDGQKQIIFSIDTLLYGFHFSGDELWGFRTPLYGPTAMPVCIAPNKIFLCQVGRTGGVWVEINNNEATEVMKTRTMQNNWSSSLYYEGFLYGFTRARLQCVEASTGKLLWSQRGFGKGSLIMVDGKLIVLSDQGKVTLVNPSSEKYEEISSFQALTGKSWTAPSFADGKLYLRNLTQIACYQLSK